MIKDDNYITIQAFMVKELKLKGIELIVYAIIYGFSQDQQGWFTGSLTYLMEWTMATKPTVIKALKDLTSRKLIERIEVEVKGVTLPKYRVTRGGKEILPPVKKFNQGGKEILPGGGKEILPNKDIIDIDIDNKYPLTPKAECQKIMDLFNEICKSLPKVKILNDPRQRTIDKIIGKGFTENDLREAFILVEESDFLTGRKSSWAASFDWLMNEKNLTKVIEGNYKNRLEPGEIDWDNV